MRSGPIDLLRNFSAGERKSAGLLYIDQFARLHFDVRHWTPISR